MSLPRRHRLSGPAAFSNVFEQAIVSSDAHFKVLGRGTSLKVCRLGMAVSRQVDKRAVERNRLKRVIRESFYSFLRARDESGCGGQGIRQSIDVIVVPRRPAAELGNRQLFERLSQHWQRIDRRIGQADSGPVQGNTRTDRN